MARLAVPWDSRWREIPSFPNYYISQYGDVFNMKRMSLLSWCLNRHGVRSVRMYSKLTYSESRGYMRSVRKLVTEVWAHEPLERPSQLPSWY